MLSATAATINYSVTGTFSGCDSGNGTMTCTVGTAVLNYQPTGSLVANTDSNTVSVVDVTAGPESGSIDQLVGASGGFQTPPPDPS